ncbi:MAG TPA: L-threonylcarbamoyladenylate synthase [Acidimicrobiales bacterium]|nr:L-threonylcarbamoyladenylate synthase [Acidimicrobiales bacterium]
MVAALRSGLVVAVPTDTVWGLAVLPGVEGAVERLFAVKERPRSVELPVLVADVGQAEALAATLPTELVSRWWPGALTVVVPRANGVRYDLGAGPDAATIGLRCPAHDATRALLAEVGPLAVTSANIHGQPATTTRAQVERAFADRVGAIAGGDEPDGTESTVVDCTAEPPRLLRQGAIPFDAL